MKKKALILCMIISILLIVGTVSAVEAKVISKKDTNSSTGFKSLSDSSKSINTNINKIKSISKSKSIFKAGTKVKISISTDKSIKNVIGSIKGKGTSQFKKDKKGNWYSYLNTKGYRTGNYIFNIKTIDNKKKSFKKSTSFTVDNTPPKVFSLKSSSKIITAGNPFSIQNIADKSSKKVIAKIKGKNFKFTLNPMHGNKTDDNTNKNNWTLNAKLNYKVIGKLNIAVYTFDSLGNYVKNKINIESVPLYVFWNGTISRSNPVKVSYSNPKDTYQKSVKALSKYVTVYEGYAGTNYTLGITYIRKSKPQHVIIAYKDPFVVYHEMGHVLNWKWSEYQCDLFAYKKTGYWII
ncbi:hypothetical protein ALNOE001_19550 [Candidatus Methanobinarius endosymbioticus]|uniref:Uncharacterized protein n=1 Tax=Candidatus Methanobinarius endosymbioticus TaxID=2006182 RepID=A0A366MAD3_9EURY|nr:hypothetical protein ALNOE001_19550 [Candidatus Methanobinarius endosymbioticus]